MIGMRGALATLAVALVLPCAVHGRAEAYGDAWGPQTVDGADILFPDAPALLQHHYRPAGGPTRRFLNRPGAWYVPVFVPMSQGVPVQLWIWQRARTHDVRLLALDAAPREGPTASVALPTLRASSGARAPWVSAPFVINAGGDGAFVLIEQWAADGQRPAPIWVQARTRLMDEPASAPWWAGPQDSSQPLTPEPPPSPLLAGRGAGVIVELPFERRYGVLPTLTPWNDPWAPR